jgi:hypothetical protein
MEWKNQLTKTPYLVLFIVLISIGVGTASAMITITLSGNVHIIGDTVMDGTLGVGTDIPDSAFHVVGGGSDNTPNRQGVQITGSDASSSPGIELTGDAEPPYIDFQNDITGTDFDGRIILTDDDTLSVKGADLAVDGDLYLAGPLSNDDDRIRFDDGSEVLFWDDSQSKFRFTSDITCPNCILGHYLKTQSVSGESFGSFGTTAMCDPGDIVTGGGHFNNQGLSPFVTQQFSSVQGWQVLWIADDSESFMFEATAFCADYPPVHIP